MARVNQTQVKPEIGFSFANGLRSLMRQDPDVIMVGEIRDSETASLAINAALTGHMVLATVHTNSSSATVARLMDMGVERFLLVSTLRVAVGQRLVRRIGESKESYILTSNERADIEKHVDLERILTALRDEGVVKPGATWNSIPFYRPKSVTDADSGFKGRIGIHEVLHVTPTLKDLIMAQATSDQIESQAKKEGMLTMVEDGIYKAALGLTTIEEVLRVISE
jgi:type II secretory ATPase GspE/PulE/Tfp pilus assembly ATPase PilB-like protein